MRTILAALAVLTYTNAEAEIEIYPENKPIANAAYILLQSNEYDSRKLEIIPPDRAVFYGGSDAPVLVARLDKCTYAIKAKGITGYKIDFSKLYGNYYYENTGGGIKLVFPGDGIVSCYLYDGQKDICFRQAMFYRAPSPKTQEFLASISYIMDNGCPAATPPQPKPRF